MLLDSPDVVIEVGPGLGFLTEELLAKNLRVIAIEFDRSLISVLNERFAKYDSFTVIQGDILKTDFGDLITKGYLKNNTPVKIIGNLPYNISSPLLIKLLAEKKYFSAIHIMVQKEIADRIVAKCDSSNYGRLSVNCQLHTSCKIDFPVSAGNFWPRPKVNSSFLSLYPNDFSFLSLEQRNTFNQVLKCSFQGRRKMLKNSLNTIFSSTEKWEDFVNNYLPVDFEVMVRPQNLTPSQFLIITDAVIKWGYSC